MINEYADKKSRKKVKLEKSPTGNVVFSEEKFNEDDGKKYFSVVLETNPEHLQMMKQDLTRTLETQKEAAKDTQARLKAINEMLPDVKEMLKENDVPVQAAAPQRADTPETPETPTVVEAEAGTTKKTKIIKS